MSATRKNHKTTQTRLLALSLIEIEIALRGKLREVVPCNIEDCCPAEVLGDVTGEAEYDQRSQARSIHCKFKFKLESYLVKESRPANPFNFVLSRGGAHAPQAPVIAGKAEAWKTPADD